MQSPLCVIIDVDCQRYIIQYRRKVFYMKHMLSARRAALSPESRRQVIV